MKHNIHSLIILIAMMFAATGAQAQDADKIHAKDGLFNHLSVGLNTGLTGAGIDVAMPVHKIVTVRAGISTSMQMVEEDAIRRAQMVDKVELQVNPNFWNFYLLGEVHPFKNQPFYFSAGLFVGSQNFVHFRNTNEDALGFLYDANQKVEDYNRL